LTWLEWFFKTGGTLTKKYFLWKSGLVALISMPLLFGGCEKSPKESGSPAPAGAQTGPTAPPPPIAPPLGPGPHPGMAGGTAQHPAGRVMEQINQYKERLETNPKDLEALINLGNANFDIQRFDTAKGLYLRALEIDPQNVLVRTDLASCYRNLGDMDQAFKELNQVLSIDPKHETALYNLGVLLLEEKHNTQAAVATWEKLIAAHPNVTYAADLKKRIEELKTQPAPGKNKN
jgi:predicted TPR repeat methyltransferase